MGLLQHGRVVRLRRTLRVLLQDDVRSVLLVLLRTATVWIRTRSVVGQVGVILVLLRLMRRACLGAVVRVRSVTAYLLQLRQNVLLWLLIRDAHYTRTHRGSLVIWVHAGLLFGRVRDSWSSSWAWVGGGLETRTQATVVQVGRHALQLAFHLVLTREDFLVLHLLPVISLEVVFRLFNVLVLFVRTGCRGRAFGSIFILEISTGIYCSHLVWDKFVRIVLELLDFLNVLNDGSFRGACWFSCLLIVVYNHPVPFE